MADLEHYNILHNASENVLHPYKISNTDSYPNVEELISAIRLKQIILLRTYECR